MGLGNNFKNFLKAQKRDDKPPATMNFEEFRHLVHSGAKEIVLDSDVVLDRQIALSFEDNNLTIDGRGHTISSSSRAFLVTGHSITLKNITFRNCHTERNPRIRYANGGCICNKGKLSIVNCNFENNMSANDGGAVFNSENGVLKIVDCSFYRNSAQSSGGAIENSGELMVKDTSFESNTSRNGGAISNSKPHFTSGGGVIKKFYAEHSVGTFSIIEKCTFSDNSARDSGNSIYNTFYLNIINSTFTDTSLEDSTLIYQNDEECKMLISESEIFSGFAKIHNAKGFMSLESSSLSSKNVILVNEDEAALKKTKSLNGTKIMFNDGTLKVMADDGFAQNITEGENSRIIPFYERLPDDWKGFMYLDDLIHSGSKEISIGCDITLNTAEQDFYEGGIFLDIDGMVIEGNGHVIDAGNLSRIFYVTGEDIVVKNVRLKGGKFFTNILTSTDDGGGAVLVLNEGSVKFIGCSFFENESQISGGAICNKNELELEDCTFENNHAKKYGGVINNLYKIPTIENCIFSNNRTEGEGGVINNKWSVECTGSKFLSNYADGENNGGGGGVLKNTQSKPAVAFSGFSNCTFEKNSTRNEGGVVNIWGGEVIMTDCIFTDNSAWNGDVIFSRDYFIYSDKYDFIDCEFNNNSRTFDRDIED